MHTLSHTRNQPCEAASERVRRGTGSNPLFALLGLLACASTACTTNEPAQAPAVKVEERQTPSELPETKRMSDTGQPDKPGKRLPDTLPVPKAIMEKLVAAVATEAGVSADEVILERAERSTFSDSSLDCPQPNMAYSQVIVEGYWVVFHVGREEYDMRVTNRGGFTRCKGSTKRAPIRYDDT